MEITQTWLIISGIFAGLLFITLVALFWISRRSQKVMQSLLMIMTRPERAKVADATRVLNTILADEINKIEQSFQTMRDTLNAQIASAHELKQALGSRTSSWLQWRTRRQKNWPRCREDWIIPLRVWAMWLIHNRGKM